MVKKIKQHKCVNEINYNTEYNFDNDVLFFYGNCAVCGKKLVVTFKRKETLIL
ncbi:hypothetical protein J4449_04220 [Candidatus Woesearchaeota archaeon]|nr:hypothetical protein [Candidatus Woesearchaeota archaeon]